MAVARRYGATTMLAYPCDILIPAAQPDVVTTENTGTISARVVLQGGNIPVTAKAESESHHRGVLCVPPSTAGPVTTRPSQRSTRKFARRQLN